MSSATSARRRTRLGLLRPTPRRLTLLAIVALLLAGGWLWLRRSALVSVQTVQVTGLSGPSVNAIRGALVRSAETMTTLDVNLTELERAVRPYSVVRSLGVTRHYPHGLSIAVNEEVPVAIADIGGRRLGLTGSGQLVANLHGAGRLPEIGVTSSPEDGRLFGAAERATLAVLGRAPYGLLSRLVKGSDDAAQGVVISFRDGPQLVFGPPARINAKWAAALAVLGNADSHGASYIDVSDPNRVAAGANER